MVETRSQETADTSVLQRGFMGWVDKCVAGQWTAPGSCSPSPTDIFRFFLWVLNILRQAASVMNISKKFIRNGRYSVGLPLPQNRPPTFFPHPPLACAFIWAACPSISLPVQQLAIMDTQETPEQGRSLGRWTREQHQRFMYAIMQYGKDWKKVEHYVRTRTGSQVRSHAQKFFSKLQKASAGNAAETPRRQEHSETELEVQLQREANSEVTPSTPVELVSLIKREGKGEGGKISLFQLRKSLDEHDTARPAEKPEREAPQASSFKGMSNILSAYEDANSAKEPHHDESFFISITKKYKRLFRQVEDFDRLIDLQAAPEHGKTEFSQHRKRSFTLPEGSDVSEEQIDEKIEEIKKRINVEGRGEEKRERRDSESSIQFMAPPLGRLTTIQEHPQEEELLSFRAVSQEKLEQRQPDKSEGSPQ